MASASAMQLHIIGTTQRTRQTLEMLFQNQAGGAYSLSGEAHAVAVILDLDGLQAEQEWLSYHHQHPEQPAVALTMNPRSVDGVIETLKKPVKSRDLMVALQRLRQAVRNGQDVTIAPQPGRTKATVGASREDAAKPRSKAASPVPVKLPEHQTRTPARTRSPSSPAASAGAANSSAVTQTTHSDSQPLSQAQTLTSFFDISAISQPSPQESLKDKYKDICGLSNDIDTADEGQLEHAFLDTSEHLLAHLQTTTNSYAFIHLPQRLHINDRYYITLDNTSTLFTNLDDSALQRLARAHLSADDVKLSTVPEDEDLSDTHSRSIRIGLAPFKWKLALWTYRGRLPAGTDISARVYIKHWPNFTRLLECPDAMRMAALWSEQPMTLSHTAQALKIPQRHVFAFYSAMHAIGLAGQARRETDQLFEEPSMSTKPPNRGFFRRMLNHLHASFTQNDRRQGTG